MKQAHLTCAAILFWLGTWSVGCDSDGVSAPTAPGAPTIELAIADSALRAGILVAAPGQDATQAWMDTVTSLSVRDAGVTDLTGIEVLPRLSILGLSNNHISDVSPLAQLDSLTFLDLTGNDIGNVSSLTGLVALRTLLLAGNDITDLGGLLSLPQLAYLELTGNPLDEAQLQAILDRPDKALDVQFQPTVEAPDESAVPDFGNLAFAFLAYSYFGHRLNIWLGSSNGDPARSVVEESADFSRPVWSPDGSRLTFSSNREDALRQFRRIYVADVGGSDLTAVSDWDAGTPAAWSPDGRQIAVVRRRGNTSAELWVLDVDTADIRQLTDPHEALDGGGGDLSWSPDGRRIAFGRSSAIAFGDGGTVELHPDSSGVLVIDVDSGQTQRVAAGRVESVQWSPAEDVILFERFEDGNSDILTVAANGGGLRRLTTHEADDIQPAWSPDGQHIVFISGRDTGGYLGDVYVMKADGSDVTRLTEADGQNAWPTWSPDGTMIAYTSDRSGIWSIHLMDPTGQFDLNVTAGSPELEWYNARVFWQPQ